VAGAGDFDDLAGRRDQRGSGAQFVDGPGRVGCAAREPVGTLISGRCGASLPRQKRVLLSDPSADGDFLRPGSPA